LFITEKGTGSKQPINNNAYYTNKACHKTGTLYELYLLKTIGMDLIFDSNSWPFLKALGYKYFCTHQEWNTTVVDSPCIYMELIPFTSQYDAFEYYFNSQKSGSKCYIFVEEDMITELADGIPGMILRIKAVEEVLV
jgi:hypothetical protein